MPPRLPRESEAAAQGALDGIQAKVKRLATTSALPTETLQTLGKELAGYQQRLQQLITAQVQVDQGQAGITTTITTLLSVADKLTAIQKGIPAGGCDRLHVSCCWYGWPSRSPLACWAPG